MTAASASPTGEPGISVVSPTLGGPSLEATLAALGAGTVVPHEILICIPQREAATLRRLPGENVRIVPTPCRGQVAQRAFGFGLATQALVLQLDDDLHVDTDCLRLLREAMLERGTAWAVSSALVDLATGQSVYQMPEPAPFMTRLQFRLLNGSQGFQPGRIDRSGGAVGVDPLRSAQPFHEVDWLPGGCVLHYRKNLVLDDYFPFPGKAYCEDIIHSHHLTSRGIRLGIVSAARCGVDVPREGQSVRAFMRELTADLRARRHYMHLTRRNPARAYLFGLNRVIAYVARRGWKWGALRRGSA